MTVRALHPSTSACQTRTNAANGIQGQFKKTQLLEDPLCALVKRNLFQFVLQFAFHSFFSITLCTDAARTKRQFILACINYTNSIFFAHCHALLKPWPRRPLELFFYRLLEFEVKAESLFFLKSSAFYLSTCVA